MVSILRRLQNNEEEAFDEIYQIYHRRVYNFILKYVKETSLAQEYTQELFIRLWDKRASLSIEKPLEAQIFVIARNLTIDALRKTSVKKRIEATYILYKSFTSNNVEETILHSDLQQSIEQILDTLPSIRKQIFLKSRKGFTYKEIAKEFSISTKTVEAHISKALKILRIKLPVFLYWFL